MISVGIKRIAYAHNKLQLNNDGNGKRYIEKASSNEKKLTKYIKEKLCDFGRHFMDYQGLLVPVSTL